MKCYWLYIRILLVNGSANDNKTWYVQYVLPAITFDATTLHVCKQQETASGDYLLFCDTLISNWLIVVLMTIRFDTHVSPTITSDVYYILVNNNK